MADNVIIKINGDIKDYTAKLEAVQKQTESLSKTLSGMGVASGIAFGVVTAGAIKAVNAFKDSLKPGTELTNILKNQGIFSEKLVTDYGNMAKELKKVTGVDDELTTSGQAVLQRFLGQTKITKELTAAILDFSAATGVDTVTAFNLVGKSIGTSTNALSRYGIEIDGNLTTQEKLQVFLSTANSKFKDQAQAINETLGPLARLQNSFGNVIEKIGEKFAPTIDSAAGSLEKIADAASENDATASIISNFDSPIDLPPLYSYTLRNKPLCPFADELCLAINSANGTLNILPFRFSYTILCSIESICSSLLFLM